MARIQDSGADPPGVQRLAAFINADDWREKRRLAEQDAGLASGQTARLLGGWIDAVASEGDVESAEELRRYADFLSLVRTHGVATAFEAAADSAARDGEQALQRFRDSCTPDQAGSALNDALRSFTIALAATTRPRRGAWWNSLGAAYSQRYDLAGDVEDLQLAVDLAARALQDTEPGDSGRVGFLINLVTYLLDRHDAGLGQEDDLDAAEGAARQAVDAARQNVDATAEHLAAALLAQARVAEARFGEDADLGRLEDAISAARAALEAASTDSDQAAAASTLGSALLSRHDLNANADDLDAAITQHRHAVQLTTSPWPRPTRLSNLGIALLTRYDRSGHIGDLDEAIDVLEQAAELNFGSTTSAGAVSTNLGLVLAERYERRRAGSDLDRAVTAFRRAVDLTPDRAGQRHWMLLNLGGGLIDLYEREHRSADLDDAINRLTEGLGLLTPTSTEAAAFHNRLSVALRHRADRDGAAYLDSAVDAARRAVDVTGPDSPLMPGWLDGLAAALRDRWAVTGTERDRCEANEASHRAAETGIQTDPATALRAALAWQSWTLQWSTGDDAVLPTRLAILALRTLVATQLLRGDKETWLRDAEGLAGRAALAFTRAGNGPAAVEAAETCRAVLLDEAFQSGEAGIRRLQDDGHGDLADRLRKAIGRTHHEAEADSLLTVDGTGTGAAHRRPERLR